VCGQSFQTGINYLSAAVDVYSDWIDACDTVAKEAAETGLHDSGQAYLASEGGLAERGEGRYEQDHDDADDLDDE